MLEEQKRPGPGWAPAVRTTNPARKDDCHSSPRPPCKSQPRRHCRTSPLTRWKMSRTPRTLNIVKLNANKSRNRMMTAFFRTLDPRTHHILAVQEPWRNPQLPTSVRLPQNHPLFPLRSDTCVCLYINKELNPERWAVREHSPDLVTLTIQLEGGPLYIHNCYIEPPKLAARQKLGVLRLLPQALQVTSQHVLVYPLQVIHNKLSAHHHRSLQDDKRAGGRTRCRRNTPGPTLGEPDHQACALLGTSRWQTRDKGGVRDDRGPSHRKVSNVAENFTPEDSDPTRANTRDVRPSEQDRPSKSGAGLGGSVASISGEDARGPRKAAYGTTTAGASTKISSKQRARWRRCFEPST